eukprot:g7980.t1
MMPEVNITELERIELLPLDLARSLSHEGLQSDKAMELLGTSVQNGEERAMRDACANVLMLSYPSQMDEIPPERFGEGWAETRFRQEGFFTLRFMAQYLDSRGTNPVNALVSPPMQRVPQPGTTTGRIVMDGQTGNGPRPFIFERENLLIVRLRIGTSASVFAQQIFYVRLSVNNPRQALLRTDPTNLWRIRVAGMNSTTLGDLVNFISLDQEPNLPGWAGNLAVLTPLEGESLQPSNLSAGATNYLSVFFQVIHAMPESFASHGADVVRHAAPPGDPVAESMPGLLNSQVDGSKYTIQFNARRIDTLPQNYWDRSWGIYQDPIMLPLTMDFGQEIAGEC